MAKDVFISHSSKDAETANKLCEFFEQNELMCWIAPRDVRPGFNFDEEIIEGIENSKVFVLLISQDSNMSDHVHRELHLAAENGVVVFPVRLEDIKPSNKLKFLLIGKHWTDAFQPYYNKNINALLSVIKKLLGSNYTKPKKPGEPTVPTPPEQNDDVIKERFKELKLGSETVIVDYESNLMWQINKLPENMRIYSHALEWISTSNEISFGGFNDWRLPTRKEAQSLIVEKKVKSRENKYLFVNPGGNVPLYLESIFPHIPSMWTQDKIKRDKMEDIFLIDFQEGIPRAVKDYHKSFTVGVRTVSKS